MNLRRVDDSTLLTETRQLVGEERKTVVNILRYLREIHRRKLYCDLGYGSLFDFAVKELKYSEGQAGRRLQAMSLASEIPEIEQKLVNGQLSLSNVAQAHSFFRELKKIDPQAKGLLLDSKLAVLKTLEHKTAREGQKELAKLRVLPALPKEAERVLTEEHSEMRFVLNAKTKEKLEGVRSLLGEKGATMTFAELLDFLLDVSVKVIEGNKFGQKRTAAGDGEVAPAQELNEVNSDDPRYIPKKMRHAVWVRDKRRCVQCMSRKRLQVDHIRPIGKGGTTEMNNLRLLCFECNQRAAIRTYSLEHMENSRC